MKAFAHIFLVTLYCLVTVGVTVSTHWCAGTPVHTSIGHADAAEPDWCCGENEPNDGCCTTTATTLVVTDDHAASTGLPLIGLSADDWLPPPPVSSEDAPAASADLRPGVAPYAASPPLTILHHVLLI
jgi:hypothetical protein